MFNIPARAEGIYPGDRVQQPVQRSGAPVRVSGGPQSVNIVQILVCSHSLKY